MCCTVLVVLPLVNCPKLISTSKSPTFAPPHQASSIKAETAAQPLLMLPIALPAPGSLRWLDGVIFRVSSLLLTYQYCTTMDGNVSFRKRVRTRNKLHPHRHTHTHTKRLAKVVVMHSVPIRHSAGMLFTFAAETVKRRENAFSQCACGHQKCSVFDRPALPQAHRQSPQGSARRKSDRFCSCSVQFRADRAERKLRTASVRCCVLWWWWWWPVTCSDLARSGSHL